MLHCLMFLFHPSDPERGQLAQGRVEKGLGEGRGIEGGGGGGGGVQCKCVLEG